jgi:predicted ATPase
LRQSVFLRLSPTRIAREGSTRPSAKVAFLDEEGANLPALLLSLAAKERKRELERLRRILPDMQSIGVFLTGEDRGVLGMREKMRGRGGTQVHELPAWVVSEGARRLAAIFTLLELKPRPRLIAIEEIENGLDPWTLREVLDALKEAASEGVQILITTHSPYLLDAVSPDQVIYVERQEGHSVYKPITAFPDVKKYEGQVPPGIMYISDYFKAPKRKR